MIIHQLTPSFLLVWTTLMLKGADVVSAEKVYVRGIVRLYEGRGNYVESVGGHDLTAYTGGTSSFPDDSPYVGGVKETRQVFYFENNGYAFNYATDGLPSGLPSGDASRTIVGWVKTNAQANGRYSIFGYGVIQCNAGYFLESNQGGMRLAVDNGCDSSSKYSYFNTDIGTWHHIALSFDGTLNTAYVNGEQVNQENPATPPNTHVESLVFIGTGDTLAVYVADFAIFDRALTPDEVSSVHQSTGLLTEAPPTPPPTTFSPSPTPAPKRVLFDECIADFSELTSISEEIGCTFFVTPKDAKTDINLYASDCSSDAPVGTTLVGDKDEDTSIDDQSKKTLKAKINVDRSAISINGGPVSVSMCVKADVIVTLDEGDVVVYYSKQPLTATFDFDGSITSIINDITETEDNEEEDLETKIFAALAVQCNPDGSQYTGGAIAIGGLLFVCFTVDSNDAYVSAVESFTITKGSIVSKPVTSFGNTNLLTELIKITDSLTGNPMQILKTELISDFFDAEGDLSASGEVTVNLVTSSGVTRELRSSNRNSNSNSNITGGLRDLQEQEQGDDAGVATVGFNLDVKIKSNSGRPGADSAANNGKKTAVVSFAAMVVAAGALFYFV